MGSGIRDHFAAQRAQGNMQVVQWRILEESGPDPDNQELPPVLHEESTGGSLSVVSNSAVANTVAFLDTEDLDEEFFDAFDQHSDIEVHFFSTVIIALYLSTSSAQVDSADLDSIRVDSPEGPKRFLTYSSSLLLNFPHFPL